ncbi:hypothetical protein Q5M85_18360 [Paraclostridium bifermentans]|nr:hypothetical protein [Paraclostridium bifermentans]
MSIFRCKYKISGKDWISNKNTYIKRIKNTTNDDEFVAEMSDILSELGNKHTEVISNKKDMKCLKKHIRKTIGMTFLMIKSYRKIR